MDFELTEAQQRLMQRADELAREKIAPRAAKYDRAMECPVDDIQDLHREGWLVANLERKYGGLGFGLYGEDPLAYFLLIEHLAYGNPSTAHCFQVHNNTLMMITMMGADEQRKRWLEPTVKRGALLPGAGAEPVGMPSSIAKRVEGGYVLNGAKHYATNAPLAEWFWVSGGIDGTPKGLMMLVRKGAPGMRIDNSFWQPMGMKACVSPMVYFENCFVPEEDVLGKIGQFRAENWLGKINFGFTANYLGAAQAIYDWSLGYTRERGGGKDLLRQLRVGELKSMIDASRLLLYHAVEVFKQDQARAMVMANEAKWMTKETLDKVMRWSGEVCGSTALFEKYPLERLLRDMHVHGLHGRHDIAALVVGAAELGEPYDLNRTR